MLTRSECKAIHELNSKNGFGLTTTQLKTLITKHENARKKGDMHTMEKIEYRLTDMNYHTECGLLSNGRYDEIRKNIEAKNNEFDSKVGMKRQANYGSTFKFGEHHFIPVGSIKAGYTFSRDKELNYSTYGDSKYPYTHIAFYKAMQNSSADVFKCVENGKLYIPGTNDLFLYIGEVKYGKRGVY